MACLTSSTANIDVIDSEKEENYPGHEVNGLEDKEIAPNIQQI